MRGGADQEINRASCASSQRRTSPSDLDHWSAAQRLAGLAIAVAVQIGVPLPQQLLGAGVGADLPAAAAAAAWGGARADSKSVTGILAGLSAWVEVGGIVPSA
jgi:hypothetical protein